MKHDAVKRYWPSGMLIHRKNSYTPPGKQRTNRREVQNCGPVSIVKKNKLSVCEAYTQRGVNDTDRNRHDTYFITIFPK